MKKFVCALLICLFIAPQQVSALSANYDDVDPGTILLDVVDNRHAVIGHHMALQIIMDNLRERGLYDEFYEEGWFRETPLIRSQLLSDLMPESRGVFVKHEGRQKTGSFKARGVTVQVYLAISQRINMLVREIKEKGSVQASKPYYIVTQSTGNHGIALIHAVGSVLEKFLEEHRQMYQNELTNEELDLLEAEIRNIYPRVFSMESIPENKYERMKEEFERFQRITGQELDIDAYVIILKGVYKVAQEKRMEFEQNMKRRNAYMSHGGLDIMAGHATAADEIHQQLLDAGIKNNHRVILFLPIGEGGPFAVGSRLKELRGDNVIVVMVQTEKQEAGVLTLKTGIPHENKDHPATHKVNDKKRMIITDGTAVAHLDPNAIPVMIETVDFGVIVREAPLKEITGPLLFKVMRQELGKTTQVGGTAAMTLEAIRGLYNDERYRHLFEDAALVMLSPEGRDNVDGDLTEDFKNDADRIVPEKVWYAADNPHQILRAA